MDHLPAPRAVVPVFENSRRLHCAAEAAAQFAALLIISEYYKYNIIVDVQRIKYFCR